LKRITSAAAQNSTKVTIFNASKRPLTDLHFYFKGEEIEINIAYTYLGV
jgi:hypothetical protein